MNFDEIVPLIKQKASPELEKLIHKLKNSKKNTLIKLFEDYYNGHQWDVNGPSEQTRFTKSQKEMWKKFDSRSAKQGFTSGELHVWNLIRTAIDIYARYTRGDEQEDVHIVVKNGSKADDKLSEQAESIFGDLNEWVMQSTVKMSVTSMLIPKYTYLEYAKIDKKILDAANGGQTPDGLVENMDTKDVVPLYWNGVIRGAIIFYDVDIASARAAGYKGEKEKDLLYWEVWYIDDAGKVGLAKYVDVVQIESGTSSYKFLPLMFQPNEKHESDDFGVGCVEVSDVAKLLDLQDEINAFVTDLGIIYRKVAIPMLKASDNFMKQARQSDIEKVKKAFDNMNTAVGQILFAPLEKLGAEGVADSQVRYLQDLLDQFFRETGIPRSVFNSEGLANVSAPTLDHLLESLKKKIGEKRTRLTRVMKRLVQMHFATTKVKFDKIDVIWPDMFSMTKDKRMEMLVQASTLGVLPREYIAQKAAEFMGDAEDKEEIVAKGMEESADLKNSAEVVMAKRKIGSQTGGNQGAGGARNNANARPNQ